jgi:hypothetical protein
MPSTLMPSFSIRRVTQCLITAFALWIPTNRAAAVLRLTPEGETRIPAFLIDGQPVRIHSQGLYVTERFFFVTGRLEQSPKRALFLRISRSNPAEIEHVDITPRPDTAHREDPADHPGGFDFDGTHFWIPISPSKPNSHALIVRFQHDPDSPLHEHRAETMFTFSDHIGALAIHSEKSRLMGVNWDAKTIYTWSTRGEFISAVPLGSLSRSDPETQFAVQDWKHIGSGELLAGGLDKNRTLDSGSPRALVEIINLSNRQVLAQGRLSRPAGASHEVTNEGMALFDNTLYFLPGDLGSETSIYTYRWVR